jgi:ABC-type transporter Mla subunit MlaD
MSVVIDAAAKAHDKQVAVINAALEKLAGAVEGLRAKAPQLPESVTAPVQKVTAPLTKVVGNPSEIAGYLARSSQDWSAVQQKLQSVLIDAVAGADTRGEGVAASKA